MDPRQPEFYTKNATTLQAYARHRELVEANLEAGEKFVKFCAEAESKKRQRLVDLAEMRHNNVQFNAKRASDKAKERLDAQFAKYLEVPLAEIKGEPIDEANNRLKTKAKIDMMKEEIEKLQKWLDEQEDEETLREKIRKGEKELDKLIMQKRPERRARKKNTQ